MESKTFSDRDIVEGILANDEQISRYFFFEKCTPMFHYIVKKLFGYKVEKNELISEFYIYLQDNGWYKLRQFNYRCKLTTWTRVVAIRFFQKKRRELIESESPSTLYMENTESIEDGIQDALDVESLVNSLSNSRYRDTIRKLILEDREPQEVANEMEITVDNLYNVKRRALMQLIRTVKNDL
ncbi:MAG: sigma-70 family RNA polymerase sigma factor [Prevotella sp.]|jgi:DNA-directed RNA polymerase specialized sigma24 family protein|nr:sigma-70 family RNA polymerase sigma factor [Prevotella sp.]